MEFLPILVTILVNISDDRNVFSNLLFQLGWLKEFVHMWSTSCVGASHDSEYALLHGLLSSSLRLTWACKLESDRILQQLSK